MKIQFGDRDIELSNGYRAQLIYEDIVGYSLSFDDAGPEDKKTVKKWLTYLYCCLLAGARTLDISWDEFVDWCDANPTIFPEFIAWLTKTIETEAMLQPKEDGAKKGRKKK